MTERRSVAIVLDPDYGDRLRALLAEHLLWVAHSVANRAAVEDLWRELRPDPARALDVTIEEPGGPISPETRIEGFVDDVLVHFPDLEAIEVVGAEADQVSAIEQKMSEYGLVRDASTPYKLRYLR